MKVTHAIMYRAASSDQLRGSFSTNLKKTAVKAMTPIEAMRVITMTAAVLSKTAMVRLRVRMFFVPPGSRTGGSGTAPCQ
jgi:hypothetical protein